MHNISDYIFSYFPEIRDLCPVDEWDSNYLLVGQLAEWFDKNIETDIDIINRIKIFYKNASSLPAGKSASDDLMTILQVGFFERLCRLPNALITIPELTNKEYFLNSREYLIQWIGLDNYNKILLSFNK